MDTATELSLPLGFVERLKSLAKIGERLGLCFVFLFKIEVLREGSNRNTQSIRQKVWAVKRRAKNQSPKERCSDPIDPIGVIKLQKLNRPSEANGDEKIRTELLRG